MLSIKPKKKDGKDGVGPRERSLWGDLISMGMVFPIAIVLGYYLGQWAGGKLGHPGPGRLIGLAVGILSGFWELFKVSKRLEKYDNANDFNNSSNMPNDSTDNHPDGGGDGA